MNARVRDFYNVLIKREKRPQINESQVERLIQKYKNFNRDKIDILIKNRKHLETSSAR